MKFVKEQFSKHLQEERRLQGHKENAERVAIALNLMAMGVLFFLVVALTRKSPELFSPGVTALLGSLVFLLGVNALQLARLQRLRRKWNHIEKRLSYDDVTGALNRTCFDALLEEEIRRAGRYRYSVTLCRLDLDDFQSFNEHFGRDRGDELLRKFTQALRGGIREMDFFCRYEKDEFAVVLPHTDIVQAEKFLKRVLMHAEEMLDCTFRGGATAFRAGENKTHFLVRAGTALHQARRSGKKHICCLVGDGEGETAVSF